MAAPLLVLLLLATQEETARLVEQLGSPIPEEREAAERNLRKLGDAAEPELRRAVEKGDVEVASRAARLIRIIHEQKLLTPRLRAAFPGIVYCRRDSRRG